MYENFYVAEYLMNYREMEIQKMDQKSWRSPKGRIKSAIFNFPTKFSRKQPILSSVPCCLTI